MCVCVYLYYGYCSDCAMLFVHLKLNDCFGSVFLVRFEAAQIFYASLASVQSISIATNGSLKEYK